MSTTIFVEGGGKSKDLRTRCREGFSQFLNQLDLSGRRPRIVACGSRADAFDRLCTGHRSGSADSYLLLVDSEEVVPANTTPWEHVSKRAGDRWERPATANDGHLHFMAVCMESWLVADGQSLAGFYGQNFGITQLPQAVELESVDKEAIMSSLRSATRDTTKGQYAKGKVSFAALGAIDVDVVRQRMSFCERFSQRLLRQ